MANEGLSPRTDFIDSIVNVTTCTEGERLEAVLAETIHNLIDVDVISISHVVYHYGEPELHLQFEHNPAGLHDPLLLSSNGETPKLAALPHFQRCFDTRASYITLPEEDEERVHAIHPLLNRNDEVVGFLELYGPPLAWEDEHLLFGLLQIYRNYLRLLEESEIDTLTGLLNRRTFDRNLDQMLEQDEETEVSDDETARDKPARRKGAQVEQNWIAVMDIDHFKKINDQFGHLYGDEVLILMANMMRNCFRHYDKLFRFGGEEFVIILKCTDKFGANQALTRFRKQVERHDFPQVGHVTVSIGFVEIRKGDLSSQVLGKADEALYYAKRHGRNQVCNYEDLVERGEIRPHDPNPEGDIELF